MRSIRISLLVAALALAGCATTGNPREGGLFGWSEAKAQDRQQTLQINAEEATREAGAEAEKTRAMESQRGALRTDVSRLRAQLDKLLAENQQLERDLDGLVRKGSLKAADVARARAQLAENERIRKQASDRPPQGRDTSNIELVERQNGRLHKEILILLGKM